MSEQPKRNEMWLEERDGKRRHLVELREGESIIGPEERAVIEAAIACAVALESIDGGQTGPVWENYLALTHRYADAVRALREATK